MNHEDIEKLRELEEEIGSLRGAILLLHRISNLVRGAVELEPTCYALLTGVTAGVGLGLNRAMLFLVDETDRGILRGAAAVGPASPEEADRVWRSIREDAPDLETLYETGLRERESHGLLDQRIRSLRIDASGSSPIALALRAGNAVEGEGDDDLDGLLNLHTAVAAPLRGRSEVRGVLYGDNIYTGRRLSTVSQLVFALLADHTGRAIENAHQFELMARQARTDALTGLAHHGTLMEELCHAAERSVRPGHPLGFLMVDLDDFKQVNDSLGHLTGDALLAGVAARMRSVLRVSESPYRYGGEEFSVMLPGADREAAIVVGERLRQAVSEQLFHVGGSAPIGVTCSVGVASIPEDGVTAKELVAAADAALLQAKSRGKNQVVAAFNAGRSGP